MVTTFLIITSQKIPVRARFLPVPGAATVHTLYWATYLAYMITVTGATTVLLVRVLSGADSWLVRTPIVSDGRGWCILIFLTSRVIALFTYSSSSILAGIYISSVRTVGVAGGCSIVAFVPLLHGCPLDVILTGSIRYGKNCVPNCHMWRYTHLARV